MIGRACEMAAGGNSNTNVTIEKDTLFQWDTLGLKHDIYFDDEYGDVNLTGVSNVLFYGDDGVLPEDDFIPTGRVIALLFFIAIFLVGFAGNALLVYTVVRYVAMRNMTYLFLLNLSVADLLYLFACLPFLSVSHTIIDWPFGQVYCKSTFCC